MTEPLPPFPVPSDTLGGPADLALMPTGEASQLRADAARNRTRLLEVAADLAAERGIANVTMEDIASGAGVGKGTVFRRFGDRTGLLGELLSHHEGQLQAGFLSGPPPLGPGAPPMDRLLAFGRSRLEQNLLLTDLIRGAGRAGTRSYAAYSFVAMHTRHLLNQLEVAGDVPLLATALLAPLEVPILEQQIEVEGMDVERIAAAWEDLAERVIARRRT